MMARQEFQEYANQNFKRVLVVDDDLFSRSMFKFLLNKADRSLMIDCTSNIQDAVEHLKTHPHYDLIISDYALAGEQTGLEFWHLVQGINREIPFILTSGHTETRLPELFDGGPAFVAKSLMSSEIAKVVQALDAKTIHRQEKFTPNSDRRSAFLINVAMAALMISSLIYFKTHVPKSAVSPVNVEVPKMTGNAKVDSIVTAELKAKIAKISSSKRAYLDFSR